MENLIFLPNISSTTLCIRNVKLQWKVEDFTIVNKGDVLMYVILSKNKFYTIESPRTGMIVKIVSENVEIDSSGYIGELVDLENAHNVAIAGIFNSYEDYVEKFFKNVPKVIFDEFSNKKIIDWESVSQPVFKTISFDRYRCFKDLLKSKSSSIRQIILTKDPFKMPVFAFAFVFEDDVSSIIFTYHSKKIKIQKNDTISFLFEKGEVVDFKVPMKPYSINDRKSFRQFEGYRQFKCPLYEEDIKMLITDKIRKWRITFNNGKSSVITDITQEAAFVSIYDLTGLGFSSKSFEDKRRPFLIQKYAKDYLKVLNVECPSYEHPRKIVVSENEKDFVNAFEWCYVYLMKDLTNGYYKIGISNNPEYREHTLQSEKPMIEMIGCKKYPTRKIAESFEKALHQAYSSQHIRGEWFSLSGFDVATILESFK